MRKPQALSVPPSVEFPASIQYKECKNKKPTLSRIYDEYCQHNIKFLSGKW
jgi:DMSO/TMAO reductase YedYZ molybdopterin-dependent catalytic subunit